MDGAPDPNVVHPMPAAERAVEQVTANVRAIMAGRIEELEA